MQLQLNPNTRKKEHPKLLENHKKLMEQAIEQENKQVEAGRTVLHGRHLSRVPL